MPLSQEVDRIFTRLRRGHLEPEVAFQAIEHLISAHVRKPPAQLDASIRSAMGRIRQSAADLIACEAEIMAWISVRAHDEDHAVMWL